jgi:hypothetical protein
MYDAWSKSFTVAVDAASGEVKPIARASRYTLICQTIDDWGYVSSAWSTWNTHYPVATGIAGPPAIQNMRTANTVQAFWTSFSLDIPGTVACAVVKTGDRGYDFHLPDHRDDWLDHLCTVGSPVYEVGADDGMPRIQVWNTRKRIGYYSRYAWMWEHDDGYGRRWRKEPFRRGAEYKFLCNTTDLSGLYASANDILSTGVPFVIDEESAPIIQVSSVHSTAAYIKLEVLVDTPSRLYCGAAEPDYSVWDVENLQERFRTFASEAVELYKLDFYYEGFAEYYFDYYYYEEYIENMGDDSFVPQKACIRSHPELGIPCMRSTSKGPSTGSST